MKQAYLDALQGHGADIKRKWELLLRTAPATTPLGNPDTLVFLMDESLRQLFALVGSAPVRHWLTGRPPATRLTCPHCRLNPLVNYFIAGQAALAFVAQTVPGKEHRLDEVASVRCLDELLLTFRFLAHREINRFCEVCRYAPANLPASGNGHRAVCPRPRRAPLLV